MQSRFLAIALAMIPVAVALDCATVQDPPPVEVTSMQLTERSAISILNATLEQATARSRKAFNDLGIRLLEFERRADSRSLKGTARNLEVTAHIERSGERATRIEVLVQRKAGTWDAEYAQRVLSRIVGRKIVKP